MPLFQASELKSGWSAALSPIEPMRAAESERTGSAEMVLFQTFVDGKSVQAPDWVGAGVGGGGAVGGLVGGTVGELGGGVVGGWGGGFVGGCVGDGRGVAVGRGPFDGLAPLWAAARSTVPTSAPETLEPPVTSGVA